MFFIFHFIILIKTLITSDSSKTAQTETKGEKEGSALARNESLVSKSDVSLKVENEEERDSPAEVERKQKSELDTLDHNQGRNSVQTPIQPAKGNLEHDDVPTIDNSIASMSPRTFDDIPVSTVFAEEKSREIQTEFDNSAERKISSDSNRSNSSRNRKISRDSKRSEKSQQQTQQSIETAKKLKKELEDTISKLLSAAAKAELYLEDENEKDKMSKDDSDTIHQVVGQTRLLCQDKLGKQFRNLCLKTLGEIELKSAEKAPTHDDLIGFWELVCLQVDTMNKDLEKIHNKKNNNWKEPEKEKTPVGKKKKTTPKSVSSQRAGVSELAKKRDAERKARMADMRAKTAAAKKAAKEAALANGSNNASEDNNNGYIPM